jgi:hypothetical protein
MDGNAGETRLRVYHAIALALTGRLTESRAELTLLKGGGYPPEVQETAAHCLARLESKERPRNLRALLAAR